MAFAQGSSAPSAGHEYQASLEVTAAEANKMLEKQVKMIFMGCNVIMVAAVVASRATSSS